MGLSAVISKKLFGMECNAKKVMDMDFMLLHPGSGTAKIRMTSRDRAVRDDAQ